MPEVFHFSHSLTALANVQVFSADFVTSPPDSTSLPPTSPPAPDSLPISPSSRISKSSSQPEPLLSLLTTSHPLLATTIGGATSAYGEAKNFSPRFKTGAEYVEGYLTSIANTVGSVGRVTGVEGGVRWFLGAGRRHAAPSDPESSTSSCKRRKVGDEADAPAQDGKNHAQAKRHMPDLGQLPSTSSPTPCSPRRLSSTSTIDTLPAYDDHRSPAYTESAGPQNASNPAPASNSPWQSRLIMSTSGLSVSMSAESLRSLRYCLRWLRWTNDHMGRAIGSLKSALEEYERAGISTVPSLEYPRDPGHDETIAPTAPPPDQMPEQSRMEIVAKINSLKGDILKTLQDAIVTVSKYAGGALPENARILVRRHLTSLPQRFRIATMLNNSADGGDRDSESAIREGAQKVLVLAKEGLEMVTQISGVVDGTIVSAEDWCERMGKQRRPVKEGGPLDVSLERSNGGDMKSV